MKKTKVAHLMMLFLLIGSYVVTLGTIRPTVSTAAKDITKLVDVTGLKMTKEDGKEVTEENKIILSDTIHLKYSWEITSENMKEIEAGDSFTLTLPDQEYFGGYEDEGPYDLENPHGGPSLGEFRLVGNHFLVTLNADGAEQESLTDGWLSIDVKALKGGTGITGGGNGSATIPPLEIVDPGGGENPGDDDEEYPEEGLKFRKDGKQNYGKNSINWSFIINYQGLRDLINTYSENKKNGTSTKMASRENGLLIDKLDPGMKFQDGSLYVTIPVQTINTSGKMGTRFVKDTNNLQVQSEFVRIFPEENEKYEDFMQRVRNYPVKTGKRGYGVYTDSEKRDTVLIAFGNLPGEHALYNDVHDGAITNAIANDGKLTDTQKSDLQTIYCDPIGSPGGGGIVAYNLSFDADVLIGEGYGDGTYTNKAQFIWDDYGSEEAEWSTIFQKTGGGVSGDFIQAKKEVEGSGKLVKPRYFEFEVVDKDDTTTPIAYGITEKEVSQKGEKVKVDFYKNKDAQGNYTEMINGNMVESGWGSVMEDGESYLIREINSSDYSPLITGGEGAGDQYDYNSKINKVTSFLILNRSKFESINVSLEAQKSLIGRDLKDKEFSFELYDQDNQLIETKENDGSTIAFMPLAFDETGEHTYKIKEKVGTEKGMTYDEKIVTATVNITKKGNQLESEVTYTDDDDKNNTANEFTNNFTPPIDVTLKASKSLVGRDLKDGEFKFTLSDDNGGVIDNQTNDGTAISFKPMTFDKTGKYTYKIKEEVGTEKGMTYDEKTVTATVNITKKGNQLESEVAYTDDDDKDNTANEFTNNFTPPIDVSLKANKSLVGRDLQDGEFNFNLYGEDGTVIDTKTNDGSAITFMPLTFDKTGKHTYKIKEEVGTEKGMTYDEKIVTATVNITKKGNQLESEVTYTDDDDKNNTANEFTNNFTPPIDVSLKANKSLVGRDLKDGEFKFTLSDNKGNELDAQTNDGTAISFKPMTFDKIGKHTYKIKEEVGTEKGMTYDEKTVTAIVNITKKGNQLESEVTYTDDDSKDNTANEFTNTFTPPIDVSLKANKSLVGRDLEDGEFKFKLSDDKGNELDTQTNAGTAISFKPLTFDEAGSHTYKIKEENEKAEGINYDGKTVTATVEISKKDNQLESKVTYTDDDDKDNTANEFTNTLEETKPIKVSLEARKSLIGRDLKDKEFSFELYNSNNQLIETKENDGSAITFMPLTFAETGSHTYTIKEKAGTEEGMDYDGKTVTATVNITKEGNQLEGDITYTDDDDKENSANMFINVYQEKGSLTGGFLVRKVDADNNEPLANAVFHVFDSNNQRVKEDEIIKTDDDGVIKVDNLPFGDYSVVEADPPQGYLIEAEPMKVSVHETSHEERNIVTNRNPKIETGITLTKIDSATGKKLQGAEFELRNAADVPVILKDKLITDENGLLHIDSLSAGDYSLIEIKAPEGYQLNSEPLKFTVAQDNKLVELTKKNTAEPVTEKNKLIPTASKNTSSTISPATQARQTSTSKQYPKTNVLENLSLVILGWGILGGLWLYGKKK